MSLSSNLNPVILLARFQLLLSDICSPSIWYFSRLCFTRHVCLSRLSLFFTRACRNVCNLFLVVSVVISVLDGLVDSEEVFSINHVASIVSRQYLLVFLGLSSLCSFEIDNRKQVL